jgi:hypothetical protein
LAALNAEFDGFIEGGEALGFNVTQEPSAVTVAVVRNRLSASDFPATARIFGAPLMAEVARALYDEPVALNHQIYVNHNTGTARPIGKLPFLPHFDKIRTLKFFIYLTDTSDENGAMGCVPGSHVENRARRMADLADNPDYRAVDNAASGERAIPIEGTAGTLFVFDTDMTHTAGHVRPTRERRIMRGHTRSIAEIQGLGLAGETPGVTL